LEIEEISIKTKDYPERLRKIYNPPEKLYILGDKTILNGKGIAIVGTRKCTKYGKEIALKFARELTLKNLNIISGLALGIDTYAHLGNVQIQQELYSKDFHSKKFYSKNFNSDKFQNDYKKIIGKTIAVLGCGIDKLYPKENKELAIQILKVGGCIITEYPNRTEPKKENFPQRNRIISGLADGVLVVEAGEKSGAIITANYGLEQGKEIFAIPGNINSPQSVGTNKLIYDGANIALSSSDILSII